MLNKKDFDPVKMKDRMIEELSKTFGIVTPALAAANLGRTTFYAWLKDDPEFKKRVDEIYEEQIDYVESKFFQKISEGSEKSLHFYLRSKGKKRGYNDTLDITSKGEAINSDIKVNIIPPKKDNE